MARERKTYKWYVENNLTPPAHLKPHATGFERKTYNWYVQRGLVPPPHLSKPKVVKDYVGNVQALRNSTAEFVQPVIEQVKPEETDEEISTRIRARFDVFDTLTEDVISGDVRGLIVSGAPGMGKSFPVEEKLKGVEQSRIIKGHASAKGLYEMLYQYKDEGAVVVLDDADSIFADEKALNLLKSALDTTEERVLSWVTSGASFGEDADNSVPTSFVFDGSIIFITNLDFDGMIAKGNRIAKHLEAIMSRTPYIDLLIKSRRDCLIRIKQVVAETSMLDHLNDWERTDVIKFIEDNIQTLREISLRTALKVAMYRKSNANWYDIAKITCCKMG